MPLCFKNKPSLVVYLTCGDPKFEVTLDVALASIEAGAEAIELGVPFSDPVADGPAIQRACDRALQRGAALEKVFKLATDVRSHSDAGLIIFSYLNPILRMGLARFAARAADSGIGGGLIKGFAVGEAAGDGTALRGA